MEWLFFVEAHPTAGLGHLGRSIGLAQACQRANIPVFFLIRKGTARARSFLAANGIATKRQAFVKSSGDLERWLKRHHPTVMVVDGLRFTPKEKTVLRNLHRTARILHIDDLHQPLPFADLIVRPAAFPSRILRTGNTPWLLGPRFATLRREFLRRSPHPPRLEGSRVLLTLGGVPSVQRAFRQLQRALEPVADKLILLPGNRRSVVSLMDRADLAVTSASHSAMELARLGIPMVTIQTTPLQQHYANTLAQSGAARHAGHLSTLSTKKLVALVSNLLGDAAIRRRMSRAGRRLVDGRGAERLIRAMAGPTKLERRLWRPARLADARWIWHLRNTPRVRKAFLGTRPIPFGESKAWLLRTLHDPDRHLFILLDARGGRIGQIRLDRHTGSRAEIVISLLHEARGKGYGRKALEAVMTHAIKHLGITSFFANIKRWNTPSLRLFASLGFQIVRRKPLILLIKRLEDSH